MRPDSLAERKAAAFQPSEGQANSHRARPRHGNLLGRARGSDSMSEELPGTAALHLCISDVISEPAFRKPTDCSDFLRSHEPIHDISIGDIVAVGACRPTGTAASNKRFVIQSEAQGAHRGQGRLRHRQSRRVPEELLGKAFRGAIVWKTHPKRRVAVGRRYLASNGDIFDPW